MHASAIDPRSSSATADPSSSRAATVLRTVYGFDAATCAALGLLLVTANGIAARLTGLPVAMLTGTGAFLLGFAGLVAWVATRRVLSRFATLAVIEANAAWVVASVVFALDHMADATPLGRTFVLVQAGAVASIACVEYIVRRRTFR